MTRDGSLLERTWHPRWLFMIVLVYCVPVVAAVRPYTDPDLWWHLRTGQWIVEHGRVPWTDPFTSFGADRLWIAYSWLLDVAFYRLHRAFGLVGPLVYSTVMAIGVTLTLHVFMSRYEPRVPRAAALTALAVAAMGTAFAPRTYLTSVLLFIIEVYILLGVRESGRSARLAVLPPLFALWANVHILFIYGLLALMLCGAESLFVRVCQADRIDSSRRVPLTSLVLAWGTACAATLINPYHVYVYGPILDYGLHTGIYNWVIETRAMDFRQPANWLVLGMTLLAAFLLGCHRRVQIFPVSLFVLGAYVSFRAFRDVWLVVVAATVVIALASDRDRWPDNWVTWPRAVVVAGSVAAVIVGVAWARNVSPQGLAVALAREFPVQAAAAIEAGGYRGPVFNPYDWGGYLIWRLPQLSVSMDGRSNLHGDARVARSLATWRGSRTWAADPELAMATLVIGPTDIALTSLLRRDARFVVVYEDDVATVFAARDAVAARR